MICPLDELQVATLVAGAGEALANAVDLAPVIVRDLNGRISFWSTGAERLYGWRREEAIGKISRELFATVFRKPLTDIEAELNHEGHWRGELLRRTRDGATISVISHWALQRDNRASPVAVIEVSNHLAAPRDNEAASRWLDAIQASLHYAVIRKTLDGIVTDWNSGAEKMFGYRAEEMVGQPISTLFPPDRVGEEGLIRDRILAGDTIDFYETVRRRKDGTEIDVLVTISPIRDIGDTIVAVSTIMRDVTKRKAEERRLQELQGELVHMSRFMELGQMVAALAHEVNQPLAAANAYAAAARRLIELNEGGRARAALEKMSAAIERAGAIMRRLRAFVKKGEIRFEAESVASVIEDAGALALLGTQSLDMTLRVHCDPAVRAVMMDKILIQQVVFNLIRNATEAMAESPQREIAIAAVSAHDEVEISIADRGPGLPPEVKGNLFKPFVTTKAQGMGLGLSICRSIVEAHGGRLWAEDNHGGGTIFRFTLPRSGERMPEWPHIVHT